MLMISVHGIFYVQASLLQKQILRCFRVENITLMHTTFDFAFLQMGIPTLTRIMKIITLFINTRTAR
jgi:hypothetical protein